MKGSEIDAINPAFAQERVVAQRVWFDGDATLSA